MDEILKRGDHCIPMKAFGQYFSVLLFTMLFKVVLTVESVDKMLKCDHSNENYC